eukprot:TRINITY_DN1167_c0_g1_i2.p1 TRINITY_DN1167_c0_g1~~TRINITY_DN1167_c0_g1_i2.p1  ORF type:complete len:519 (+),score=113.15 TRINITY_DN1167_c0_g1_i2:102-1658(+)
MCIRDRFFVACVVLISGAVPVPSTHYRAAIVQCAARGNNTEPASANLPIVSSLIEQFVAQAAEKQVQILVLPEALGWGASIDWTNTSVGRVQAHGYAWEGDAPLGLVPCDSSAQHGSWWATASCAARRHGLVVVLNALHKLKCSGDSCPEDGWHIFNAEVAFSEEGKVLAVYHKSHIWGTAPVVDEPASADPTSFHTSFGVTFGMFVCYDIEFTDWLAPLQAQNINHFVFSTDWMVDSPPAYAIHMLQQGFSRVHNSVLLAANLDMPGGSGSGIYSAGEVLALYFNSSNEQQHIADDKMLVADVPIQLPPPPEVKSKPLPQLHSVSSEHPGDVGISCQIENKKTGPSYFQGNSTDVNFGLCATVSYQGGARQTLVAGQGPVRCEADVLVNVSKHASDDDVDLVLFAARTNVSVVHTPDSELLETCAMMLCKKGTDSTNGVVCETLWSAVPSSNAVELIELRAEFSPSGTVIPMAAVDGIQLLQPSKTNFKSSGLQHSLKVEVDSSQHLFSALLYAQFQ